jgi:hypothetical protein
MTWSVTTLAVVACGPGPRVRRPAPEPAFASACTLSQGVTSLIADARAAPHGIDAHLEQNFADGRLSWLMKEDSYQQYVVATGAARWGRCNDTGCYLFAAPAAVIHRAVDAAMRDGRHDAAALGKALGLPAANLEGPLRLMTLDLGQAPACVRLPVDRDPGVWACKTPQDTDCFKFGGYTSGGVPEVMVLDAPVDRTTVEVVP